MFHKIKLHTKIKIIRGITIFFHLILRRKKRILFSSFMGKQYSDNPRAISETMHKLFPDFELVWFLKDAKDKYGVLPSYIKIVNGKRLSFYRALATSTVFVTNEANGPFFRKFKNQFYVQTWHGDRGFKKILYEVVSEDSRDTKISDSKDTDLFMVGSEHGKRMVQSAFHYYGQLIDAGCARNDRIVNATSDDRATIKTRLGIEPGTNTLLYAPTFRDSGTDVAKTAPNIDIVLEILERKTSNKWVCLSRMHPTSKERIDTDGKKIIDVSDYPDMADLLIIADFLITDYSSSACDFTLTQRPVVLSVFDMDEYVANNRDFCVDLDKVGFPYAKSQDELNDILESFDEKKYADCAQHVNTFFGVHETGHASQRICEAINEFYNRTC